MRRTVITYAMHHLTNRQRLQLLLDWAETGRVPEADRRVLAKLDDGDVLAGLRRRELVVLSMARVRSIRDELAASERDR